MLTVRTLLRFTYYTSVCLGLTGLSFDFRKRRFYKSNYLRIYAYVVNILILAALPYIYMHQWDTVDYLKYKYNNLMRYMQIFSFNVATVSLAASILLRWVREPQQRTIVEQLVVLEVDYFDDYMTSQQTPAPAAYSHFERLILLKHSSTVALNIVLFFSILIMWAETSVSSVIVAAYGIFIPNISQGVLLQYLFGVCHIGERICMINAKLHCVYVELLANHANGTPPRTQNLQQLAFAEEVHTLSCIHKRLAQLLMQLNKAYEWQKMVSLSSHVLDNIVSGYFLLSMIKNSRYKDTTLFELLAVIVMYIVYLMDPYLINYICDAVESVQRETQLLLRQFTEFEQVALPLERSCNLYVEQFALLKFRSNLFVLNKHTAFVLLCHTLQATIILLQYDLEERFE